MIKNIRIKNFRGIKEMELDKFKKYNIFVGDNSSCKTTVMEAMYTSLPTSKETSLIKLANSRGTQVLTNNIQSFFYNADLKNEIELTLNNTTRTLIKNEENRVENENIINKIGNLPIDNINKNFKLLYDITVEENNIMLTNTKVYLDNFLQIASSQQQKNSNYKKYDYDNASWVTPLNKNQIVLAEAINKILEAKKKNTLLEAIQILEPDVDDIYFDGSEIKLSKKDIEIMIPVSFFGNGVVSIIGTVANIIHQDSKVIFVDEIEDGIHYLNFPKYCEYLIKIIEEKDIQLFFSTHSREFLEMFYKILNEISSDDNISLYRFQKKGGEIKKVYYSKEKAIYSIKEDWDIR